MIETLRRKVLKQTFTDLKGNSCRITSFDNEKKTIRLKINDGFASMTYADFDRWIKKIMENA